MITPGAGRAAAPPVAPPVVFRHGRRRVGAPGQPPGFDALAVLRDPRRLFGVGSRVCRRCRPGHLARGHAEQSERLEANLSITLFHRHMAYDTLPTPLPWRLPAGPAGLFEHQGSPVLLPPRLECLPYSTSPWPQGQEPDALFQTPPQGPLALGRASGDNPDNAVEPQGQTCLKSARGLRASAGLTIPATHPEGPAAVPTDAKPQQHLFAVIPAIFVRPGGGPWCPRRL